VRELYGSEDDGSMSENEQQLDIELKNLELLGKDPSDLVFFKHK